MVESATEWLKSSFCETGACVEVALVGTQILLRNNTPPDGPSLSFEFADWQQFLDAIQDGQFACL